MFFEKRESKTSKNGFTWRVGFYYLDQYGIKQKYTKGGFPTKKKAQDFGEKEKIRLEENGGFRYNTNKTFNEVFLDYMEIEGKFKYAQTTKYEYMKLFNHYIKNSIGRMKIRDLHYSNIQSYFNKLSNKGKGTIQNIKKIFGITFKFAIKNNYVKENPTPKIENHGEDTSKEKKIITYEQLEQLVTSLSTPRRGCITMFSSYSMCMVLYLGYFLGTRISETLALTKEDFDFENNQVFIDKRLEYKGLKKEDYYVTDRMKTKSSKAIIPLAEPLKEVLLQWFEYNPYDLICCTENGEYLNIKTLSPTFVRHSRKLGFEFHSHMLRYSFVTTLIEKGVNVKTVSELARHSNIKTTLDVYTKVSKDSLENAINDTFNDDFYRKVPKKSPNQEISYLN